MSDLISREDTIREIVKRSATYFMDVEAIATVIHVVNQMPSVEVPRWIPCSEQLPREDEDVLVYLYEDMPCIAYVDSNGQWRTENYVITEDDIPLAWMPLPHPYDQQKSEKV